MEDSLRLKEHWVSLLLKLLEFSGGTSFSVVSSVTYWKILLQPLDQLDHFLTTTSVPKSPVFRRACPSRRAFVENRPSNARIFVILPVFL